MGRCENEPRDSEMEIDIAMHSCAAECVFPLGFVISLVRPGEGSREGMFYQGASVDKIINEGHQRVKFLTFKVAKVTRLLASLPKMTQAGNRIILDWEGSYVSCRRS